MDDLASFESPSFPSPERETLPFRPPPVTPAPLRTTVAPPPVAPVASKEMTDRLETMSQRLADMQALLAKQAAAPVAAGLQTAGSVGQGFSPETIDKLLKIIGNVIQQVDILQKNIGVKPAGPAPTPPPTPSAPIMPTGITGSPGLRGGGGPITGPQPSAPPAKP